MGFCTAMLEPDKSGQLSNLRPPDDEQLVFSYDPNSLKGLPIGTLPHICTKFSTISYTESTCVSDMGSFLLPVQDENKKNRNKNMCDDNFDGISAIYPSKSTKDSGIDSCSSLKSEQDIHNVYDFDNLSHLSLSLISEESFNGSITSLFSSVQSISWCETPRVVFKRPHVENSMCTSSFLLEDTKAKRMKFDENHEDSLNTSTEVQKNTGNSILNINLIENQTNSTKYESETISLLEKMEDMKRKCQKSRESKKILLGLVKQYKLLIETNDDSSQIQHKTATVSLSEINFPKIAKKVGQNDFFVVVSTGHQVHISKFLKSTKDCLTFFDEFIFDECPIDFRITVQLYSQKLSAKISSYLKKAAKPFMKRNQKSTKNTVSEPSAFELVEEFNVSIQNCNDDDIGTIRDVKYRGKSYKVSLGFSNIKMELDKEGFLKVLNLDKDPCVWRRSWCILSDNEFKMYEYKTSDCENLNGIFDSYDLRYSFYTTVDSETQMLILKIVRPQRGTKDDHLPKFKNNFVISEMNFKSVNINDLCSWRDAINDVIETLSGWRQTFLNDEDFEV